VEGEEVCLGGDMARPDGDRGNTAIIVALISGVFLILAAVIPLWLTGVIGGGSGGGNTTTPPTVAPGGSASIFLSKESAPGGATVLVSGDGFSAGETIDIRVHTFEVASTHADGAGKFSNVAIVIPTDLSKFAPQQFTVSATGRNSVKTAQAPITVSG
jgi:hypothetical protein